MKVFTVRFHLSTGAYLFAAWHIRHEASSHVHLSLTEEIIVSSPPDIVSLYNYSKASFHLARAYSHLCLPRSVAEKVMTQCWTGIRTSLHLPHARPSAVLARTHLTTSEGIIVPCAIMEEVDLI
jgi:hypothetical protein